MKSSIHAFVANLDWLVTIPNNQTFTQPQFHFGDLVQWAGEDANGIWARRTGRITGMHFTQLQIWQYQVRPDAITTDPTIDIDVICAEYELKLIQSLNCAQRQITSQSEWLNTAQAAQVLGVSPEQMRRLRRKGLFKVGHHCRDTSVPSSGLSRWQWHVVRCGKALEVPPEKRSTQFR